MTDIRQYEPLWGSWRVDRLLGEGSFGKVWKVHKEEFGKTYEAAVKIISIPQSEADLRQAQSEGLDLASARSYFHAFVADIVQEIELMDSFRGNSNIVSLEDHKVIEREGEIGWDILIRMELLTTLSELVADRPLTPEAVIELGVDICRALELCALQRTIHRDIKPDNIFVSHYGDFKLGDFGIARQVERTMTGLTKGKGTYSYMAPEVFHGREYGPSVDLYSLGIVMYRFLNRNRGPFLPPFPDPISPRDRDEALARRMGGEPLPPISGIDLALDAIVRRACAYRPEDRFQTAAEMKAALEPILGKEHISIVRRPNDASVPCVRVSVPCIDESRRLDDHDSAAFDIEEEISPTDEGSICDERGADEREGTVLVFRAHAEPLRDEDASSPSAIERLALVTRRMGSIGTVSSLLLAGLSLLSGDRWTTAVFLPLWLACAGQCAARLRHGWANAAFGLALLSYLVGSAVVDFRLFDYAFLGLGLGLLSLWAGGMGRGARSAICLGLVACAVATATLILRVRGDTHYAFVAGAAAIPLLMLLAAPVGPLLGRGEGKGPLVGIGASIALLLFPSIAFVIYILDPVDGSSLPFHIADASFIGFSSERFPWWRWGRVAGSILQIVALGPLLFLAAARAAPDALLRAIGREGRGKVSWSAGVSAFLIVVGLLVILKLSVAAP